MKGHTGNVEKTPNNVGKSTAMFDRIAALRGALTGLASVGVFDEDQFDSASDAGVLEVLTVVGAAVRRLEGVLVMGAVVVEERSRSGVEAERCTNAHGCRDVQEVLTRTTGMSRRSATAFVRAGRALARASTLTGGERFPSRFPALRESVVSGVIGIDGLAATVGRLRLLDRRVNTTDRLEADAVLAEFARGTDKVPAMSADELVPLKGLLLPDVAGQLLRIIDAQLSPRLDGPRCVDDSEQAHCGGVAGVGEHSSCPEGGPCAAAADPRSRSQRQHDALVTALDAAARSGELATIGGAAPTLVVCAEPLVLSTHVGTGEIEGLDARLDAWAVHRIVCSGVTELVSTSSGGRVVSLCSSARVFDQHQRRAIVTRDGGCVIPGCTGPAAWCEIHHVREHAKGGPTHTDNGALVCWFHHRTLGRFGWDLRMRDGTPEVRGTEWWDPHRHWRPADNPDRATRRIA